MSSAIDFRTLFRQHSTHLILASDTQIFRQEESVRDIYLLEKGLAKMIRLERNGQETILDLRFAGSFLGAASALANQAAPMTAIAITNCEVYRLSVKKFLHLFGNNALYSPALLELISRQRNEQINLRAQQSTLNARSRLILLLLRLAKDYGLDRRGRLSLALPITKQDIAGLLGITPQRLSNILREMKRDGVIAEEKQWIILPDSQMLLSELDMDDKDRIQLFNPQRKKTSRS